MFCQKCIKILYFRENCQKPTKPLSQISTRRLYFVGVLRPPKLFKSKIITPLKCYTQFWRRQYNTCANYIFTHIFLFKINLYLLSSSFISLSSFFHHYFSSLFLFKLYYSYFYANNFSMTLKWEIMDNIKFEISNDLEVGNNKQHWIWNFRQPWSGKQWKISILNFRRS